MRNKAAGPVKAQSALAGEQWCSPPRTVALLPETGPRFGLGYSATATAATAAAPPICRVSPGSRARSWKSGPRAPGFQQGSPGPAPAEEWSAAARSGPGRVTGAAVTRLSNLTATMRQCAGQRSTRRAADAAAATVTVTAAAAATVRPPARPGARPGPPLPVRPRPQPFGCLRGTSLVVP
jgi:hypothetical protein